MECKEHDASEMTCLHKDTMRDNVGEYGNPLVRVPTQQEFKIAEHVSAYNT